MESRFCRGCGRFLTHSDRTHKTGKRTEALKPKIRERPPTESEGEAPFMRLFPYTPYPQQLEFMEDAYNVLSRRGGVLVAEACNGFGKTVCALAVALSLGRRIIYATRTHEQVRQVLKEVERINGWADVRFSAVCLASRRNLCLNEACRRLPPIDAMETCNILKKTGRCPYRSDHRGLDVDALPPVLSVRRLLKVGRETGFCPYFLARRLSEAAAVVVAPYQYIFNEAVRIRVGLDLEGKTLIFDEAHNADKIGQEALSDTLSERGLRSARRELETLEASTTPIDELVNYLEKSVPSGDEAAVKEGLELRRDLEEALEGRIESLLESWEPLVEEVRTYKVGRGLAPICHLNGVLNFLSLVNSGEAESYAAIYRLSKAGFRLIEYRCLDPSLAVKPVVEKAYSTLIMSGTLSPLNLFTEIVGLQEVEVRAYSSIAKPENIRTFVDTSVTTRFKERTGEMLMRYGERVAALASKVPNGVLIFFPQRGLMTEALKRWLESGLIERRRSHLTLGGKRVYIEGEGASENAKIVDEYKRAAKDGDGAVLFAVFRGRNAEGSNFPYEEARGVILVGLPYADYRDPAVKAQIDYLNRKSPRLGERWYVMDAFRAANQAMGRGIRHRDDWCTFFLLDRRYGTHWRFISKWATENGVISIEAMEGLRGSL